MKVYETNDLRNVALVGHGHSGKTSLTAGLLFTSGATPRLLRVDEGNTVTDFDDEEIQRKITISTGIAAAEWGKKKINLLDTPGFNIFINDTKASMVAADAALVVVDGVAGVEVQTEKVWRFAEEFKLPRAIVINKLDRERSSFERALESVQSFFGRTAIPIHLPIGVGERLQRRRRSGAHEGVHVHDRWRRQRERRRYPGGYGRGRQERRTKRWWRWSPRATTRCSKNSSTKARCRWSILWTACAKRSARCAFSRCCAPPALHNIGTRSDPEFLRSRIFPAPAEHGPWTGNAQRHRRRARDERFRAGFRVRV